MFTSSDSTSVPKNSQTCLNQLIYCGLLVFMTQFGHTGGTKMDFQDSESLQVTGEEVKSQYTVRTPKGVRGSNKSYQVSEFWTYNILISLLAFLILTNCYPEQVQQKTIVPVSNIFLKKNVSIRLGTSHKQSKRSFTVFSSSRL